MDELDVVRDVAERLNGLGVAYMLTGSIALNFYAQPRMTRDIDIVIDVDPGAATGITSSFGDEYYVYHEAVASAIQRRSMFNIVHNETLVKVDFIVRKEERYRRVEFGRRRTVQVDDTLVSIVSKEDLILSKLDWARDSHSELQLRDVQHLLATGYDADYVDHWLHALRLYDLAKPLLP